MTEYYLQCLIHRAEGDLEEFQIAYKGLEVTTEPTMAYSVKRREEEDEWPC